MRRILIPLIFGLLGVALLAGLGFWQMQRLAWKEAVLAEIDARIAAAPAALPGHPDPERDRYRPVRVTGRFGDGALRVLVSRKGAGAGYRLISPFETAGGRRVLVDRGFIPVAGPVQAAPSDVLAVTGNLHWPDDRNSATPQNDVAGNTWFARDVFQMSEVLDTEPLLIVVRELSRRDVGVTPLPVDTAAIPNDHLQYAITWFALASVWAVMTGGLIRRMRTAAKGAEP